MQRDLTVKEALFEAKKSLKKKDFLKAENLFTLILEADPNNFSAKKGLQKIKNREKDAVDSTSKEPRLSAAPKDLVDQCLAEFNSGNYGSAEKLSAAVLNNYESVVISNVLGIVLHLQGRFAKAIEAFERGVKFQPDYADSWGNMARTLEALGQYQEGVNAARKAIELDSKTASSHNNLASNLRGMGRAREAVKVLERALELSPNLPEAHNNLGNNWGDIGDLGRALESYEKAIHISPDFHVAISNLLFTSFQIAEIRPEDNLIKAQNYGQVVAKQVEKIYEHEDKKVKDKIRVGFVSGDFRNHPVGYFLEGFLKHMDFEKIEFFAYPSGGEEDALTERIKGYFHGWKPISGQSDREVASEIFRDQVDVLFDMSGHTRSNRLPLFAWKPAPVQVTWGGYFATTGVKEIDYILGNWEVTPPGEEHHFVEKVWRLPNNYFCFTEPDLNIKVESLPALDLGYATYGCFNSLIKINDNVIKTWAELLSRSPRSRLFLKTKQLETSEERDNIAQRFYKNGIDRERLILEGPSSRHQLLNSYNRVDIGLDPFPYPGGATTAEALWMGVPIITMNGSHFLSHVGESVLTAAGFPQWIALSEASYIEKAVNLSSNFEGLALIRNELRKNVLKSPLFDASLFARDFQEVIHDMSERLKR